MLSEAYEGKLRKGEELLRYVNCSKRVARAGKVMKVVVVQDLTEMMKMLKK
jgi:hypothetical protein